MELKRCADLAEAIGASRAAGGFARGHQRGEKQGREEADDGDGDE